MIQEEEKKKVQGLATKTNTVRKEEEKDKETEKKDKQARKKYKQQEEKKNMTRGGGKYFISPFATTWLWLPPILIPTKVC